MDILKIDMYYFARFEGIGFMQGVDFSALYLTPTSQKERLYIERDGIEIKHR